MCGMSQVRDPVETGIFLMAGWAVTLTYTIFLYPSCTCDEYYSDISPITVLINASSVKRSEVLEVTSPQVLTILLIFALWDM